MAKCRTCGAEIVWGTTKGGTRIPVDPEPVPDGNLILEDRGSPVRLVRVVGPGNGTHRSHFASCPDAAQHRRPKKAVAP